MAGPVAARSDASVTAAKPPAGDEEELTAAAQDNLKLLAEAARFASPERVGQVLEALLFAAEKPLNLPGLMEATQFSQEQVAQGMAKLGAEYKARNGGIALADLGGRWQLRTEPAVGAYVRRMLQVKPLRLTRAAMETLAIIAYRQPLTRPEMEDIRGVDCGAVTKALLERKLDPHPGEEGRAGASAHLWNEQGVPRAVQPARPDPAADAARVPGAVGREPQDRRGGGARRAGRGGPHRARARSGAGGEAERGVGGERRGARTVGEGDGGRGRAGEERGPGARAAGAGSGAPEANATNLQGTDVVDTAASSTAAGNIAAGSTAAGSTAAGASAPPPNGTKKA